MDTAAAISSPLPFASLSFSSDRPHPVHLNRRAWLSLPLACGAAACNAAAAPSAAEPIRIALIEGLSGPFGNAGEAVFRNLLWATERINQRGGVKLPGGARPLLLVRHDSKGNAEEAISARRA